MGPVHHRSRANQLAAKWSESGREVDRRMLSDDVIIDLRPEQFGRAETVLATAGGTDRLDLPLWQRRRRPAHRQSGRAYLAAALPGPADLGRRAFLGRPLTMGSMFEEPVADRRTILQTYGAFLLHCGATAMGDPGSEDSHPAPWRAAQCAAIEQAQLAHRRRRDGPFHGADRQLSSPGRLQRALRRGADHQAPRRQQPDLGRDADPQSPSHRRWS